METMYLLLVLYGLLAIAFSFLCSVAEAVLLSVTPSYIVTLRERKKPAAHRLEKLKQNIDRPLAAILSLNTIAHTVGAAGVGAQSAEIWGSRAVGIASAVMTLLILIVSEIIPKTIGAVYWRPLAPLIARMTQLLVLLLYPFVVMSELLTRLISGGHRQNVVTREEVAAMASLIPDDGEVQKSETHILRNLFRLRSLTTEDIMTPRTVILAFPQDLTVDQVLQQHPRLPVSRIPIYGQSIDDVTGFVLKVDILLAQAQDRPETPLRELRRDIPVVMAKTRLSDLFQLLLKGQEHIALVVDEHGGTDGLVTLEDLIETLLGLEIVDEADTAIDMRRYATQMWQRRAERLGLRLPGREVPSDSTPSDAPERADSPAPQADGSSPQDFPKNDTPPPAAP